MNHTTFKYINYLLNRKQSHGFTLIELLVVVIIIGILSAVALPNLFGQVDKARTAEARQFLGTLNRAQQAHFFTNSTFATTFSDLGSDVSLSSKTYDYVILTPTSTTEIHQEATPKAIYANKIKTLESAVYRIGDGFTTGICIGSTVLDNPNITATNSCDNGEFIN